MFYFKWFCFVCLFLNKKTTWPLFSLNWHFMFNLLCCSAVQGLWTDAKKTVSILCNVMYECAYLDPASISKCVKFLKFARTFQLVNKRRPPLSTKNGSLKRAESLTCVVNLKNSLTRFVRQHEVGNFKGNISQFRRLIKSAKEYSTPVK